MRHVWGGTAFRCYSPESRRGFWVSFRFERGKSFRSIEQGRSWSWWILLELKEEKVYLTVKPTLPIRSTLRYDCHGSVTWFLSLFLLYLGIICLTRLYACFYWIFELFTDVLSLIYLDFGSKIIFICFSFILCLCGHIFVLFF